MLKSYLALATPTGLKSLVPEHTHATQALVARAARDRSVCCWAVLPDTDAAEIEDCIDAGETVAALALLEAAACSVGRILPDGRS
jgi:hypothetical protein